MADLVSDGMPFETPIGAADEGYAQTSPSLGSELAAQFQALSPIEALTRRAERSVYDSGDAFGRALYGALTSPPAESGMAAEPVPYVETPVISADEVNRRFAPEGTTITDQPLPEGVARSIGQAKTQEIERESVLSRFAAAHSWPVTFGTGLAAFAADPLNLATTFLPGIGEDAILGAAGRVGLDTGGIAARTIARGVAGAASGAIAQAPLSALRYGLGREEASDYDLRAAFGDMMYGAAGGAAFHAGFGAAGDAWRALRGSSPGASPTLEAAAEPATPEADETTAMPPMPSGAAPVLTADAATKADAMRAAVAQLAEGRPVEVDGFFPEPPEPATAVGRFMDHPMLPEGRPTAESLGLDEHELARRADPDTFAEFDRLAQRQATQRRWLDELAGPRQAIAEEAAPHAPELAALEEQIAGLRTRIEDATPRMAKIYQNRLDPLLERRDSLAGERGAAITEITARDTPDMMQVRQDLAQTDYRMRDLAPARTAAYGQARRSIESALDARVQAAAGAAAPARAALLRPQIVSPGTLPAARPATTIDIAAIADRQRDLSRDGFAPGIPEAELRTRDAEVYGPKPSSAEPSALNATAVPERRRSRAAAGDAGSLERAARGSLRVTPPPSAGAAFQGELRRVLPAKETIGAEFFKRFDTPTGIDLKTASDAFAETIKTALSEGRAVTLHAEGKAVPITAVNRGMIQDAQGQRWGTMLIATDNTGRNRIEIASTDRRPEQVIPSVGTRPPAPRSVLPAEVQTFQGGLRRVLPAKETIGAEFFKRFDTPTGIDLKTASDAFAETIKTALSEGRTVTLHAEGKAVPITAVTRGMIQDASGQRWGTMLIATDNTGRNRVEIASTDRRPEQVIPSVGTRPQAPRSVLPAEVQTFRPEDLASDGRRFQFKEGGDEAGLSERLKGVTRWDPIKAGMTVVYEDADGGRYIVDGHQRLGLARRIAADDPAQDPRLFGWVLRAADGITPEDVRVLAAAKNIAEGTGTAIDAAKVLRGRPDLAEQLPPRSELVRQARNLVNLDDHAFRMVVNDVVPPHYAAIVGRLVPDDARLQEALLELLAKTDPENATQAEAIVRQGMVTGTRTETQASLFGDHEVVSSLYLDRAKILDRALKQLRRDRTVFSTLVREAETLEAAGNRLAGDVNTRRAIADANAIEILQVLASRRGPISDALGAAARRARDGGNYAGAVREFVAALRGEAESGNLNRLVDGAARGGDHAGAEDAAGAFGRDAAGVTPAAEADAAERAAQVIEEARAAATERTAQGEQYVIPGTERSAQQAMMAREATERGRLMPRAPQEAPGGLFAARDPEGGDLFGAGDDELAAAERELAASGGTADLLPEERAELDRSAAAMERSGTIDQAAQAAAECLTGAGI